MESQINTELIKQVNKNFLIRYKFDHDNKTSLISAGQYHKLINDIEIAKSHFERAFNSGVDKCTIKLRRGLRVDFVSK